MLYLGIKCTHDGAVAAIDDGRLLFSIEAEKLRNGRRYSALKSFETIDQILATEGIDRAAGASVVIDGWGSREPGEPPTVDTHVNGREGHLPVAPYIGGLLEPSPIARREFAGVSNTILSKGYASYSHAAGHVMAAYCSSPLSLTCQEALVLIWDGGMLPQLYRVKPDTHSVKALGPLFPLVGNAFSAFSQCFEPFNSSLQDGPEENYLRQLEVPGKAMAYAALGQSPPHALAFLNAATKRLATGRVSDGHEIGICAAEAQTQTLAGLTSADLISAFQDLLGQMLVDALKRMQARDKQLIGLPLCFGGGCALNIKWNSMLRRSGMFPSVWIPPFTNDSGGAIGAACCEMATETKSFALEWNVYSGPSVLPSTPPAGWTPSLCDEAELALLLHSTNEPVVVIDGRAELGPRALGNRSILASARSLKMKSTLNRIKDRESYRPVAPVCLTSAADQVFSPGGADPYMLFEHRVRADWVDKVPAIIHLDGTARLQTVDDRNRKSVIGRILNAYAQLSGVPVLCNTSANHKGQGFFPDIASAMSWGRTDFVWSDGTLYTRQGNVPQAT